MALPALHDDCTNCAALCCVAHAFDKSDFLAIDKDPGTPCPHLKQGHRCAIHSVRRAKGFQGCIGYTCNGAGQFVTQALFKGRSWQSDPGILAPMMRAFLKMRRIQECHLLLTEAKKMHLPEDIRGKLTNQLAKFQPVESGDIAGLERIDIEVVETSVREFLKTLRVFAGESPRTL